MLRIVRLGVLAALIVAPRVAFAQDIAVRRCVDVSIPRQATEARNGRWIELTPCTRRHNFWPWWKKWRRAT
jgi:hypothetical protein